MTAWFSRTLLLLLCWSALPLQASDLADAYTAMRRGDFTAAAGVFESAADAGSVEAQYQLGKLYMVGRGVDKDETLARKWLDQAARSGEANAQYTLGLLLLRGSEQEQGREWLQQAANQGHERARAELGKLPAAALQGSSVEQWQQAALGCDMQALTRLLQAGAPVSALDEYHRNALYYLVACDSLPGMRLLMDHGIDVNN
ncbi:MAG: sel1 repeat family protein, partial [Gammaproteobacteria bacterium]|nr:sel1 repeat family protein [Gammaproteobacteria bacterium]